MAELSELNPAAVASLLGRVRALERELAALAEPQARPLLTFLSPCYDEAENLEHLHRAIVATCSAAGIDSYEILWIENGSRDESETIMRRLAEADQRLRIIQLSRNFGFQGAITCGFQHARGEWVAVLDADDVAMPDRLQTQMEFLAAHSDVSVLGSWIEIVDADGQAIGLRRYPATHEQIQGAMRRYNPIAQPAVVFSRAMALACGAYQGEPYVEDYDLWCRMLRRGARFANIQGLLTRYRVHGTASKQSHLRHVLRHTIAIKQRCFGGEFRLRDRLRLVAERAMLLLPPRWVYLAFRWITFRRPARSKRECCHTAKP